MVRVSPTLLALLIVSLAVPVSGAPLEGMVAAGEGAFSRCGPLDVVVAAAFTVRGHVTDAGWSLEAIAVTKDACPEAMADTFTSSTWDPEEGGCLASRTQNATLCMTNPRPSGELVRYDLTWQHASYRYFGAHGLQVGIRAPTAYATVDALFVPLAA